MKSHFKRDKMKKQYKNFTIESTSGKWWAIRQDGNLIARTPNEEEARRVIWLKTQMIMPITDDMMEVI
jgi:hypothetical protein